MLFELFRVCCFGGDIKGWTGRSRGGFPTAMKVVAWETASQDAQIRWLLRPPDGNCPRAPSSGGLGWGGGFKCLNLIRHPRLGLLGPLGLQSPQVDMQGLSGQAEAPRSRQAT